MEEELEALSVQRRRAGNAAVVVAVLAAALTGACMVGSEAAAGERRGALAGTVWEAMQQGGTAAEALASVGLAEAAPDQVPDWFVQEVAALQEGWAVRATEDWDVVDIACSSGTATLRAGIEEQLAARGWVQCPTGADGQDTYMKDEGGCTWMMVAYSETSGAADAVLRILRA